MPPDSPYEFHDQGFRYLFNSYYNAVGPMHTRSSRGLLSRPTVQQVLAYRQHVDERMFELLERGLTPEATGVLTLGLASRATAPGAAAHRHQTSLRVQSAAAGFRAGVATLDRAAPVLEYKRFDGGLVEIGQRGDGLLSITSCRAIACFSTPSSWRIAR